MYFRKIVEWVCLELLFKIVIYKLSRGSDGFWERVNELRKKLGVGVFRGLKYGVMIIVFKCVKSCYKRLD